MRAMNTKSLLGQLLHGTAFALASLFALSAQAAVPGITGPTFSLSATPAHISQPDGATVYSWGYGCTTGSTPAFTPAAITGTCITMQVPGPTLIVTQGQTVTVTLTNNLPASAGNTSILFPGFAVTATNGVAGLLTREATPAGATKTVMYTFTATSVGTHAYYSGTQGDLQVEMGLYGALVVLPATANNAGSCSNTRNDQARAHDFGNGVEADFRLAHAAYDHAAACYDREFLFQFSEIDPRVHRQAEEQAALTCTGCMVVETEPYKPAYYMINGRSMPDNMDPVYARQYPHQPYNGNPHMHPGELTLLRIIGQGRWQHPFHEHGKGLNWDVFGHGYAGDPSVCIPDANGYHNVPTDQNYYEWCGDHGKALESKPFGQVGSGGPVTLPDPNIVANGPWYAGSPYLGGEATGRAVGATPIPPSGTVANSPTDEAGFAFMWHSHNEREITTNNIFPGGMLMMMLVDPRVFVIDESK